NRGEIPIYEPGLDQLVRSNVAAGRLRFSSDVADAIGGAKVTFIAVGTPPRPDGAADLSAVFAGAESVAAHATGEMVVVCKSTVPVGTNARVRKIVQSSEHPMHVVSNPEFLKEGEAINDFLRPDRVVIGVESDDEYARNLMGRLYKPLNADKDRMLWM